MMTFREEMAQQPGVLRELITKSFGSTDIAAKLCQYRQTRPFDRIILTGMGSSLFACYITANFLRGRGHNIMVMESAELLLLDMAIFTPDTLVIAVSQSGESVEVLELAHRLPHPDRLITVTNYPNSKLHAMSDITLDVCAGIEYLTSTKTYTNTLAAMQILAYLLADSSPGEMQALQQNLLRCADQMERLLTNTQLGDDIAEFISDIHFLLCVGSGYSYTSASHSEIVVEEAGKFFSSRFTPGQFIHGPIELIQEHFGVVLYDFNRLASAKCDEVRDNVLAYGGKVLLVTNRSGLSRKENQLVCTIDHGDDFTSPLVEIVPLEMGINSLCLARGQEPGRLSRVVKRIVP